MTREITKEVHCSKCGKVVSGWDPELGLVVRAWVECADCLEKASGEKQAHTNKQLESLIYFWKDSLAQHRLLMSPSTVYLVEQTIKSLEKLKQIEETAHV